jgi:hypothetical protein
MIRQEGFAKKRGDGPVPSVIKPLLWTSMSRFLAVLTQLREEVRGRDHQTRKAIAKSFSTQLGGLCKHLWCQHLMNGNRTGTHLNRAIYANVAYKTKGAAGQSLTHFIKNVLGHDTMGSASNYMNIDVAFQGEEKLLKEAQIQESLFERDSAELVTETGKSVSVCKPPIRRMSPEARNESVIYHANKLRSLGVPVKRSNLIALGFQSKAIRKEMLDEFRDSE